MMGILMVLILLFVSMPAVSVGSQALAEVVEVADIGNTLCPVSGDKVNPKVSYVYQGKKYHFCCTGCIKKFQKNPEKYIAKLAAAEKAGKEDGSREHAGHEHAGHEHGGHEHG